MSDPTGDEPELSEGAPPAASPPQPPDRPIRPGLTGRVLGGATTLGTGQVVRQAAVFVRSLIVIRTLTKVDWGIASTLALSIQFVEMSSNMNLERLLIQAEDGDDERMQRTAQVMRAAQGALMSLLLFVFAPAIATLFAEPDAVWAYRLLAIVPLATGLTHFDPTRYMRELRYAPSVIAVVGAEIVSLALVAVAAVFIRDFRLVLFTLLATPIATALLTHVFAERPYRWQWHTSSASRLFSFGWPLALNGLLMYLVLQGDRLVIGSSETVLATVKRWMPTLADAERGFDKADLALYSTAMGLTWMPTQFLSSTLGSLNLPLLSREQSNPGRFAALYRDLGSLGSLSATLAGSGLVLGGAVVTTLLYGEGYREVGGFIGLLGVMHAVKILRMVPTAGILAMADTRILLLANVGRATGFLAALLLMLQGAGLAWIPAAGIAAEVLALALALALFKRRQGVSPRHMQVPLAFAVVGLAGAGVLQQASWLTGNVLTLCVTLGYLLCVLAAAYFVFPRIAPLVRSVVVAHRERRRG